MAFLEGKTCELHSSLMPIYLVSKIVGVSSYSLVKKKGKFAYEFSSLGIGYSVVFMVSFFAFYLVSVDERNKVSYKEVTEVTKVIDNFQLYSSISVMSISVLILSMKQKRFLEFVRSLEAIDRKFMDFGIPFNYSQVQKGVLVYSAFLIFGFALMEIYNCSMFLRQIHVINKACKLMCYIPLLACNFIQCQFSVLVYILKEHFRAINATILSFAGIRENFGKSSKVTPLDLESCCRPKGSKLRMILFVRELHGELCEVSEALNRVYSLPLLVIMANTFVSFTSLAYLCFESFYDLLFKGVFDAYHVFTKLYWALTKIVQIFFLSFICELTAAEADKTVKAVHKTDDRRDLVFSRQVDYFSKQIFHFNVNFTAFGFFRLDMSLFYSVVCAATTYLLILVQLDDASE